MQDYQLLEKMATFNRERVPERAVHAKGAGAYGTFTVANDITKYSKAAIFSKVGKQTPAVGFLVSFARKPASGHNPVLRPRLADGLPEVRRVGGSPAGGIVQENRTIRFGIAQTAICHRTTVCCSR